MKGILLAGGSGTRLYPVTRTVGKQLLPVYDKPMIYYPLSTLMLAGIREILIISTPRDLPPIRELLGDGSALGIRLEYKVQDAPRGIPEAFVLGRDFIGGDSVCLILGDNIFYSNELSGIFRKAGNIKEGGHIFAYRVKEPRRYGVVGYDAAGRVDRIIEKPENPPSNYAVIGIYFYDNSVVDLAANLPPGDRGETEITDINRIYLEKNRLQVELLGRGFAWFDTGVPESLLDAGNFIKAIEDRQGLKIACIEEVAYFMGFIDEKRFCALLATMPDTGYAAYLREILAEIRGKAQWGLGGHG